MWLALTVSCIIMWGVTDVLYKKSLPQGDSLSHFKSLVWSGIIMAIAGTIMAFYSDTFVSSLKALKDNLYLIPVSILYPIALFFGLKGKQELDVSVVSPLENIDGAMAAIILYGYFIFTGNAEVTKNIGLMEVIGTILIVVGVIAVGLQEHKLSKTEEGLEKNKRKHRFGALVLIFPLIYNLVDALSMVLTSITVNETVGSGISDIDFFIFESFMFVVIGILMWLYMLIVKKYAYNPFKKEDRYKCSAAIGETCGTMLFIFAIAINPVLTSPIVSSYCIVAIIVARILLKEKLNKKQYLSLLFLIGGIILLGLSELIRG